MLVALELRSLALRAHLNLQSWSHFVAQAEFAWQNPAVLADAAEWQKVWFEMEIINALALAQWEEQGFPRGGLQSWCDEYQQDALSLVAELLGLIVMPDDPS
ncbi:hypothetical protein F3J44_12180 [Pantoea sp. Tr-811]|nr:hypothetical protein [Pantoea sp. Tr-811]